MAMGNALLYPAFLDLRGLPVVVVGGGPVAARKARGLAKCGARVTVVATEFSAACKRLRGVTRHRRPFRPGDLRGARLIFMATDDLELNTRIGQLAEKRGIWANVASPPEMGRLAVPACVRRGRLLVAVSTGGASAAAARALRQDLSARLDPAWGTFLDLLRRRRHKLLQKVSDQLRRRHLLLALGDPIWVTLIRRKGRAAAARRMDELINHAIKADKEG
jgi:precorrin-2 dehydrogenase/sirohydrochlorin ferrochelatase